MVTYWAISVGVVLLIAAIYYGQKLRGRPRTMSGRWAAGNGYVYRRDLRVHLFVQGPPFDRGVEVIERVLLVGSCAGRPSLITHFGWYDDHRDGVDLGDAGGACVALALQLPGEVTPLQVNHLGVDGEEFTDVYEITCDVPGFAARVVGLRLRRAMLAWPSAERVNFRLDGDAMIVWLEGELVSTRQLEIVHDCATELYRLLPRSLFAEDPSRVVPVSVRRRPASLRTMDIHGRPGEAWQTSYRDGVDEVSVSLLVDAAWPRLSIEAYEWLVDHYNATSFDKPDPSAYPLVDIMFAVRSADENFRRQVLDDLAEWLPLDERTRRCGLQFETDPAPDDDEDRPVSRITAYAPGQLTNDPLVTLLADVVHEVGQRLSRQTYRYPPVKLSAADLRSS
ncbi:hypothetical protein [Actinophytocola sediminis]